MFKKANFIILFMTSFAVHSSLLACLLPEDNDTPFGISAARQDIHIEEDLTIPPPGADGKIPTLNQTGFMTADQNPYNLQFIEFAVKSSRPVLDIGAAYGLTSLPALEQGATVIANDIDPRHLGLLRQQTPPDLRGHLILNKRRFPNETDFPDASLGAILLCRVAHFLTGDEMTSAIEKMKKWLVPGGQIFVITLSPHHRHLRDEFLPIYVDRANNHDLWPGMIENMHKYVPHEAAQIPQFVHVMDTRSLGAAFRRHGFTIIKEGLFDYARPTASSNEGKGYYGIIVEKPNGEQVGL